MQKIILVGNLGRSQVLRSLPAPDGSFPETLNNDQRGFVYSFSARFRCDVLVEEREHGRRVFCVLWKGALRRFGSLDGLEEFLKYATGDESPNRDVVRRGYEGRCAFLLAAQKRFEQIDAPELAAVLAKRMKLRLIPPSAYTLARKSAEAERSE